MPESVKYPTIADQVTDSVYYSEWRDPENILSGTNNIYSESTFYAAPNNSSNGLVAKHFDFAIPSISTITGIMVSVECKENNAAADATPLSVYLTKDGTNRVGASKGTLTEISTSDTVVDFGGAGQLWSTTWIASQINADGFGVIINFAGVESYIVSVDTIYITVYYNDNLTVNRIMIF